MLVQRSCPAAASEGVPREPGQEGYRVAARAGGRAAVGGQCDEELGRRIRRGARCTSCPRRWISASRQRPRRWRTCRWVCCAVQRRCGTAGERQDGTELSSSGSTRLRLSTALQATRHPRAAAPTQGRAPRERPGRGNWPRCWPPLLREDVGLCSEAGMPAVADPGAELVALAQREGVAVVPLGGRRRSCWRWRPAA